MRAGDTPIQSTAHVHPPPLPLIASMYSAIRAAIAESREGSPCMFNELPDALKVDGGSAACQREDNRQRDDQEHELTERSAVRRLRCVRIERAETKTPFTRCWRRTSG